jgi:hypothetical protein
MTFHSIEIVSRKVRSFYRSQPLVDNGERPRLGFTDREVAESLWPKSGRVEIKKPGAVGAAPARPEG